MIEQADKELSSFYLRFYFDEDVSANVVANLRSREFDVTSSGEVDMLGQSDEEQLAFAISQKRVLVTHNRKDFELLHQQYLAEKRMHLGIIIAKRRFRDEHVVTKLLHLLNQVSGEEAFNKLFYL